MSKNETVKNQKPRKPQKPMASTFMTFPWSDFHQKIMGSSLGSLETLDTSDCRNVKK
jgi:hypothetical protein